MVATVWAQKPDTDLTTTSLEDLMNIEVTSVSKKEERLSGPPPPSSSSRTKTSVAPA